MSSELKRVCVVGASGRMGGRVLDALSQSKNLSAYSFAIFANPHLFPAAKLAHADP